MGSTRYTIKISQEEDKSLYAEVIELPWCFTTGETIEEIKINIKEAIECYLEGMRNDVQKNTVSFDYLKQYA
jgi:predicted RNase H-like HicB family nuclease